MNGVKSLNRKMFNVTPLGPFTEEEEAMLEEVCGEGAFKAARRGERVAKHPAIAKAEDIEGELEELYNVQSNLEADLDSGFAYNGRNGAERRARDICTLERVNSDIARLEDALNRLI